MLAVVGHLAALGHRRIAFAPATMREEAIDRRPEALRTALAAHGLVEAGMLDGPTAVCCNNDVTAMELLDALERRGRPVPASMSVVGFDDIPVAGHLRVGLTTVRQDAEQMGGLAAEMLLEAIAAGRHPSQRVVLPTELVVRTSTGPAPEA
jgi:LacI family transcriptional regulator